MQRLVNLLTKKESSKCFETSKPEVFESMVRFLLGPVDEMSLIKEGLEESGKFLSDIGVCERAELLLGGCLRSLRSVPKFRRPPRAEA